MIRQSIMEGNMRKNRDTTLCGLGKRVGETERERDWGQGVSFKVIVTPLLQVASPSSFYHLPTMPSDHESINRLAH
jgi:hypothetical protein